MNCWQNLHLKKTSIWALQIFCLLPAQLIHGVGHALALFIVTGDPRQLNVENILENRRLSGLLKGDLDPSKAVITHLGLTSPKVRVVSLAGILANISSMCLALTLLTNFDWKRFEGATDILSLIWLSGFIIASLMSALSLPDILGALSGKTTSWACGPAFAIRRQLPNEKDRLPVSNRLLNLVEILAREASTRGGQSAGFSILTHKNGAPSIVFDKVVKKKREDIVRIMMARLRSLVGKAVRERFEAAPGFEAVLLHLRYATGGATHWHNAQPHWYEHFDCMIHHCISEGHLETKAGEVFNMIAHNGDMDGVFMEVTIDGQIVRHYFPQREARAFLTKCMPWTSSEGNSDSRSVAEWVDFHLTQGLAYKALRFAWHTAALDFNQQVSPVDASRNHLLDWAEKIDQTLIMERRRLEAQGVTIADLSELPEPTRKILEAILRESLDSQLDEERFLRFFKSFEQAFLKQDLAWVMRRASRDMVGEFALMVCTTLEPRMGVFCLTQAFSLGYNRTLEEIFGSAEPLGITCALQQGDPDDDSLQIYLKDGQYALIEFDSGVSHPIRIFDRAPADDALISSPTQALRTTIRAGNPVASDSDWFEVNGNPHIPRTGNPPEGNAIQKDLSEIPYVLSRIRHSFEPDGENFATMTNFSNLLIANLLDAERGMNAHDLVLFGVDFNQDLLQEFALALRAILPGLRVRAENSGNILKEMKRAQREGTGTFGPRTIFLGASNSAQTQSTLAVIRKARDLVGPERCFVLTQNFLNSMSEAIGQRYQTDAAVIPNTFVNLSDFSPDGSVGRRRAEAATLVIAATQAVLTEILIRMCEIALRLSSAQETRPIENSTSDLRLCPDLDVIDLDAFRDFQSAVYEVDIPNRTGYNPLGDPIDSPDFASLDREAIERAENQLEFVRAYGFFAAYILIATLFGVPVFAVILSPVAFIPGVALLSHVLDAILFLLALWLIHLGIRKWQGRPLFDRIGARAEVYIDRRYIARIIERYNATLFSNAPGFITPFFYWADTVQDALHRFGIRAHRGVVTIHRTPDERIGIEEANNASEENMVYAQLGGIFFNGGQPQSRDKVRKHSCYEDPERPFQTVLSDSLAGLRAKYDGKLSPEAMRLINRRLIDLCDGLITEFIIGFYRKEIVNQSIWAIIRWMPGIHRLHQLLLENDIDLKNLCGDADTANQAQIQSTKHPVSPMDTHVTTMRPRSTFQALGSEIQSEDSPFAVFTVHNDSIDIHLNQSAFLGSGRSIGKVLRLHKAPKEAEVDWLGKAGTELEIKLTAHTECRRGVHFLVVEASEINLEILLPIDSLSPEQRECIFQSSSGRPITIAA